MLYKDLFNLIDKDTSLTIIAKEDDIEHELYTCDSIDTIQNDFDSLDQETQDAINNAEIVRISCEDYGCITVVIELA